ncbi:MAG: ABC-F family ATP-binding cassette domain-containing protein [Treponemataceae bacterium]
MNVLSLHEVTQYGREKPLFKNVSFGLNEGEKAAIIGKNGSGKSTLLSIISGNLAAMDGKIVINDNSVSFLPQTPNFNPNDTILDHIFKSNSSKLSQIKKYEEICSKFENYDGKNIPSSLKNEFENICFEMDKRDLWSYENSVKKILTDLGILDFTQKMGELSGGMAKKVALAQVMVEDTKLLLLDEPTNHLDISTINILQNYLTCTDRAVLMVTHDRYFLDAVCNNIYELDRQTLKSYQGNYSSYLEKKEIELEIEKNTDRRMGAFLRIEKDWLIRGPCARGTKAKARIQNIEKLSKNHIDFSEQKKIDEKNFSFETKNGRLGGKILELENIGKKYAKLKDISFSFNKGDKIGIFGNNGSGKSTLLNIITGKIQPDTGTVTVGKNTKIAYYEQNPVFEKTSQNVIDYIKQTSENITLNSGKTYSAGQLLDQFGFEGKIQYSPVSTLSGGERKRLYLVNLLMSNPNFFIMDEPTNDFDIFTMSILESFLNEFSGCLLLVSHDRYFMDKIVDSLFVIETDGTISRYEGKCSAYLDFIKEKKSQTNKDKKENESKNVKSQNFSEKNQKPRKLSFKEQKEFEQLEIDILKMEERKKILEALMSSENASYTQISQADNEYSQLNKSLEEKYQRWENLASIGF